MLKGFSNFLLKELKELIRDPKIFLGMIVVPLIMFPVLGAIMSFSVQSAQEKAEKAVILILNNDVGNESEDFIIDLASFVRVSVVYNVTPQQVLDQNMLSSYNSTQFLEIPKDFSAKMVEHQNNPNTTASIGYYGVYSGGGMFEEIGSSIVDSLVEHYNRKVAPDAVHIEKSAVIKGNITQGVDPTLLSRLMISQAVAMPITIMILLTYSMQIAATSVAMEKEEKTLETLLTLPMDRFAILMGKLSGSILVAAVGAATYMVGFNYYMGSFSSAIPAGTSLDLASLGLVPSVLGYLLLGISLFVTLLAALALAVIISSFAEDVRGAQSIVGYIYPLIFIPSFVLMYVDVGALPFALRILIYAIPFSHPILASKAVIMGDYWTAGLGIVYVAAFTFVIMFIASRLFATEKILTAKLKFRGLRRGRKPFVEELQ